MAQPPLQGAPILLPLRHLFQHVTSMMQVSFLGMSVIHMIAAVKDPPARYPDLFTYMFVGWSFLHIFFALIILSWLQLSILRPEKKKAS